MIGRALALRLGSLALPVLFPSSVGAHEAWVLSSQQMAEWNAKPVPEIFLHPNLINVSMCLVAAVFLLGWISLHFTGARELFPDLQVRLASYGGHAALALRVSLFLVLITAGTGLLPHRDTAFLEAPTLLAPDLELRALGPGWGWIPGLEVVLALSFLVGVYVRAAAVGLLGLTMLGLFLFGLPMLAYLGAIAGAAIYLLLQGAGSYHVPMPSIPGTTRITAWLAAQPRGRAQWLLQTLAGANLAYLGIAYKALHPNLMIAVLGHEQVPTFGLEPATFVLSMAFVETLSGLLIMAGVLMRALSIPLLISFVAVSVVLGEGVLAHVMFYGLLVSLITNGDGRWRRPVADDTPGRIVVLGGGFAGVHCAMRLERLLGPFTNVELTLVHTDSAFLFQPLVPEVVAGAVQPGSIVNPIRRLCPRTRLLQGEVTAIDPAAGQVTVAVDSAIAVTIDYDQLIVALEPEASFVGVPGLLEHALPVMTIGDALFLRQRVLECVRQAEFAIDGARRRLLTFGIVGGGLRGAAMAAEIRALLDSALVSHPGISRNETRVVLVEENRELLPRLDPALRSAARRRLERLRIEIFTGSRVAAVTPDAIVVASGARIACATVIGTQLARPRAVAGLPGAGPDGRLAVDPFLCVHGLDRVLAVADCAATVTTALASARREIEMGRHAAYNALALHRGYRLRRWSETRRPLALAALGRRATVVSWRGVRFGGIPAWLVSRLFCLLTLPGLERNLRVLIDWLLDIPFRTDIVVLTPQRTPKLGRAHYEAGDQVIRQGERGDCAYLILDGEVEVLQEVDGHRRQIATCKTGDCFGEIALLADAPRSATVRCLTSLDVLVLPRDQLAALTQGHRDLRAALERKMADRLASAPGLHP